MEIKISNPFIGKEEINAVIKVLKSGNLASGNVVSEFEREFKEYIGVKHVVAVSSGTSALLISLLALGIGPGDEVITTAFTFRATIETIIFCGALPKLVDIDPSTYNINPDLIEQAITKRTRAILPVHLYGLPCDMNSIMRIAKKHNLKVIEDCAQAHGATLSVAIPALSAGAEIRSLSTGTDLNWKKVGSIGDAGCFSFYPTKNLGCFGDGGMVVTNNKEIYDKVKLLRMYGEKTRYKSVILGRNSRLDELQAAILLVKLKYLDKWNKRRREIAELYLSHIAGPAESTAVDSFFHVYHLFVIRTKKRDQLKKHLEEKGIQTAVHYPTPVHLQESFRFLGYKKGDFPVAEKLADEILSIPMFPELTESELMAVVSGINSFFV